MKHYIKLALSAIITCSIGYAENLKECLSEEDKIQGCVEKYYYGNRNLWWATPYKNGEKDGIAKWHYSNGNLYKEVLHKDDEKEGIEKIYYENGNLMWKTPYKNGGRHGVEKWYYENGNLRSEDLYKDDKREGIAKHYSENGNLIAMITYQKDEAISYECANGRKILDINKLGIPIGYSGFMGHIDAWKVEINMYKTCG